MKIIQNKTLLLAAALIAGFTTVPSAFADATVTVPTPNVFNGKNNWHCTATDYRDKRWGADGHDYNDARQNALDRCDKHSNRPRSCEVHRGDCDRR
ncbi:MAG: hypothetical protein K0R48_102 [Gammaproteobacteria bacterium]|nr:hypothetical protein [Gammaproteobacteria bacterium]